MIRVIFSAVFKIAVPCKLESWVGGKDEFTISVCSEVSQSFVVLETKIDCGAFAWYEHELMIWVIIIRPFVFFRTQVPPDRGTIGARGELLSISNSFCFNINKVSHWVIPKVQGSCLRRL